MRLIVQPGRGLAARRGSSVLFIADAADAAIEDLLRVLDGNDPAAVIDDLFDVIRLHRPNVVTGFCALVDDGEQLRVAIHGALELAGEDDSGSIHLAGRDAKSRVEDALGDDVKELSVAVKSPKAAGDPFLDLVDGVVEAGSITLAERGAKRVARPAKAKPARTAAAPKPAPRPEPEPEPEPEPVEEEPIPEEEPVVAAAPVAPARPAPRPAPPPPPAPPPQPAPVAEEIGTVLGGPPPVEVAVSDIKHALTMAVPVGGPAPTHAEAPDVEGRLCRNGHLNSPTAPSCWICGAAMSNETARGARPPLGRLTTKDKRSYVVDGDFILGRKTDQAPDVVAGKARGIDVPVTEQTVSRVHAEIRLRGWDVVVVDLKSSNGTYYLPPGATSWLRVDSDTGTPIVPGTTITVGGLELFFEGL